MKIKCKVNDLAFIKKAIRPVNIGRVVTCKELLGKFAFGETIVWNGEEFASPEDDYMWVVSSSGNLETQFGPSKEAMIRTHGLLQSEQNHRKIMKKKLLRILAKN